MNDKRRQRILGPYDVTARDGLEIGPLDRPLIPRSASRVRYVDQFSTAELKAKFAADPGVRADEIVEVDYALRGKEIAEVVQGRFDYLLASHVFEHVPNPVQWLNDVDGLLRPGGVAILVVPDRRFTFDALRPATSAGDVLEAFYTGRRRPSFKNVFDQSYYWRTVNAHLVWAGKQDARDLPATTQPEVALVNANPVLESETYVDVHCNVLTGDECVELLRLVNSMGLTKMRVSRYVACERDDNEFVIHLTTTAQ